MKKGIVLLLSIITLISFSSCKKDSKEDERPKTKTELLTARAWVYDEYFTNYHQPNTTLAFKRGKPNFTINLNPNWVKFNNDGTYTEVTETGATVSGTWKFLNGESQLEVINSFNNNLSTIVLLTETNLIWHDQRVNNYGKMIPR